MKFTLSWLKEYLETDASLDDITVALNDVGLEVEEVKNLADILGAFTVAHVKEVRQHPDADRLKVCDVETRDGMVQVVCGAPNVHTGMSGIFAPPGTIIPGTGVDLRVGVIRGVESAGMLCSEREMMLSDKHEGIIDLSEGWAIGTPAAEALGLNDPVIDIAVTPNRPDALGIYGIARDLDARGLGKLKLLEFPDIPGTFRSPIDVELKFDAQTANACPIFVGRYIRNLNNGPSPKWMQARLHAIGLRSISALVDVTNYLTHAYARPVHVFDADKVKGNIQPRLARNGEKMLALDGKEYELDESMTVIADDAGPGALGGIMGDEASSCTASTRNVFIEVAYFDPIRTATTGRKLAIQSDARYRFERGVDPAFVIGGAQFATQMILDFCGGEPSELVIAGAVPDTARSFTLRKNRVKTLAGIKVGLSRQKNILEDLGFIVKEVGEGMVCTVPPWRPDVHGEADLVEEIVRIVGLDNIPNAPMSRPNAIARPVLTRLQKRTGAARRTLAARGLNEAVTWSFLPEDQAVLFGGGGTEVKLANPISSELTDMRPSLLPNLITAVGRNIDRGFANLALFEVGQAYLGDKPEDETVRAAGVRRGHIGPRHWAGGLRDVDAFDAKADALAALEAAGAPIEGLQVVAGAPNWFHPGRSGTCQLGPKNQMAHFGEIHPRVLNGLDVKGPLVGFEIILNAIPAPKGKGRTSRAAMDVSDLQTVTRDFAFVIDEAVEASRIVRAVKSAEKQLISNVSVFDLFEGEAARNALGEGKKSLAIEVTLQPRGKTMTDEEINAVAAKVVANVEKATGGTLRA